MEQIVPWAALIAALKPYYFPHAGTGRARRPIGLERMLRMYCLQQWYSLADEALEDAIYDSQALRNFVGIDLGKESVPDATTLLGFRHLLEKHDLTKTIFETVNRHLRARGLLLNKGTLTDATILAAPSSTKNKEKARDPQMHQTRKGKHWYFGMKAHIGAHADSGLVHTVVGRNGPRKLDRAISEIFLGFQAAKSPAAWWKYTASGVRRSSALWRRLEL